MLKNTDVVVCLIGQPGSGKDTIAEQFVKVKGFKHIPTGNIIRVAERVVGNTIISGPINTAEVKYLKDKFGKNFILVAIEASIEVRYRRALIRGQIKDNVSPEEFKAQEEAELHSATHNLKELLRIADYTVDNSRDILTRDILRTFLQLNSLILGKQRSLLK